MTLPMPNRLAVHQQPKPLSQPAAGTRGAHATPFAVAVENPDPGKGRLFPSVTARLQALGLPARNGEVFSGARLLGSRVAVANARGKDVLEGVALPANRLRRERLRAAARMVEGKGPQA